MITQEQIRIYVRYNGDPDWFTLSGSAKEKKIMNDRIFSEIQNLIQDIIIIKRDLSAKQFTENTRKKIAENNISPETVDMLYQKFSR